MTHYPTIIFKFCVFPWGCVTLGVWKSSVLILTLLPNHKKECIDLFLKEIVKQKYKKKLNNFMKKFFVVVLLLPKLWIQISKKIHCILFLLGQTISLLFCPVYLVVGFRLKMRSCDVTFQTMNILYGWAEFLLLWFWKNSNIFFRSLPTLHLIKQTNYER